MQLARNLFANAGNQIWSFLLNIAALPLYLALVGPEAYAMIGFALTVQVWTTLLDVGMSPILARDMARFRCGEMPEDEGRDLLHTFDWICLGIVSVVIIIGWSTRQWWATSWFHGDSLKPKVISDSVTLIFSFSVLRWAGSIYRSGLMGLDKQVMANAISLVATTGRLILPLAALAIRPDIRLLLGIWVGVSLAELAVTRIALGASLHAIRPLGRFSLRSILSRARLAGGLMFLAIVYVAVTQSDKLLLSKILPLSEYGYFSLAVVLSNGVLMLTMPISQSFQPQLTSAAVQNRRADLDRLVETYTVLTTLSVLVPAIVIAAYPERLLFAWTGNGEAAEAVAPYLGFYVLGSALVGPVSIAYALQLAFGTIRMHVAANVLLVGFLVPANVVVASRFGAEGAAILWFGLNLAMLLLYCPLVLRRFVPGSTLRWLRRLAFPVGAASAATAALRLLMGDESGSRWADLAIPTTTGLIALAAAIGASEDARTLIRSMAGSTATSSSKAEPGPTTCIEKRQ